MSQKFKGKKDKNDPSRFEGEGVNFRAKLIGVDDVDSARGDKMCQDSLQKLKAAVKASGEHKQRIIVNVSLEGLTLIDEKTKSINHNHAVHRISFISRDVTDNRAFGYIYGTGDGTHKFYAIKTLQAAEMLVLTLRDLFQCVYELKKQAMEDVKNKQEGGENSETTENGVKEGGESIYQVPTNGAPVEGKEGESIYQVPGSNEPVKSDEPDASNLVNLENELQSLQAFMKDAEEINRRLENGIEQIDTFEDLFSVRQSGDGAVDSSKSDPWGAPASSANSSAFGDSFGAVSSSTTSSASSDLFDTVFSTPVNSQSSFPTTTTSAADPFATQMSQLGVSNTTSSPFSLPGPPNAQRSASPFGGSFNTAPTTVNPMSGFGAPQTGFGQSPFGGGGAAPPINQSLFGGPPVPNPQQTPFGGLPVPNPQRTLFGGPPVPNPQQTPFGGLPAPNPQQTLFGGPPAPNPQQTPFGNPMAGGMFGAPTNPAMGFNPPQQQSSPNPFSSGGFGIPTQAPPIQAGNLFDAPVMMPTSDTIQGAPQEAESKPRAGSDLFGDLVGLGPTQRKGKTPKQLFDEQKNEPKKSLNQLKPAPVATPAQNPNPSIGDSFSIFGGPPPTNTTDPLYATVNKNNPNLDPFDLL